jgi:hypothetical protein
MSRAFVKEDGDEVKPRVNFGLPSRRDPKFNAAAALALLEAARDGYTELAEEETGYKWGDPALFEHVKSLIEKEGERPEEEQDRRFIQVARRFLAYRP